MAEQLVLTHVSKRFAAQQTAPPVLHDVSLHVAAGSFLAILGPSGCGKSTLLRLLAGLDQPSSGTVQIGSQVVTQSDPRCGVVFQEPRLFPWRNIADNVALGTFRRPGQQSPETLLRLVGLEGWSNVYPHQLSGGMAQRAALDALTRMQMQDLVADVHQQLRPTVVLVTHDVDEALYLADTIVILGQRPTSIKTIIDVPLARPRDRADTALVGLRGRVLSHFGLSHAAVSTAPNVSVAQQ
jgi:ABC-type nitrate/sulfonate/bicarbonate transport system ATPase subunit